MHDSSRLPELGARGGGWVAGQFVLLAAIALSALVGVGWTGSLKAVAVVVGLALMGAGGALVVLGGVQLGSSLTPFPAPQVISLGWPAATVIVDPLPG